VFAIAAHCADPVSAGKPRAKNAAPNLEFLEYLGTLESDEENWTDVANVELTKRPPKTKSEARPDDSKADNSKAEKPKVEAVAKAADGGK